MKIIHKDLGSFRLHFIKTEKFKTVTVKVIFHTPIKKEEITKRNILLDLLLQSSMNYKSRRDLTIKAEELYSVDIYTNNQRLGNYMVTSMNMEVLNDKFTEEDNVEKAIAFFSEIIFFPDCENKSFQKDKLELVKKNTKIALESIKEEPSNYAMIRMNEVFQPNSKLSYRMMGYIDGLDNITEKNVYSSYQDMIQNDLVDIFVAGDFDDKKMLSIIKKYFKFKMIKKNKGPYTLGEYKIRRKILVEKEESLNSQSRLVLACPFNKLTYREINFVLPIANIILGGGVDSRLFQEAREKYSLCYSIHSFVNRLDHLLVITSGIDKDNYPKMIAIIEDILGDLKKGRITNKEIDVARECYYSSLEEIEESLERLCYQCFFEEILGIPKIEERRRGVEKVTKQELCKFFKKLKIDTIFFLEGRKE